MCQHVATLPFVGCAKTRSFPFPASFFGRRWLRQVCLEKPSRGNKQVQNLPTTLRRRRIKTKRIQTNFHSSSRQQPCFRPSWFIQVGLHKEMHMYLSVFSSVVEQATPQIRQWPTRAALKRRQLELFSQWMKRGEGWVCWVPYIKTKPFPDSSLFSTKVIFAGLPIKAFSRKQAKADISAFSGFESKRQGSPKLSPKAIFPTKEHDRATDSSARMSEPRTRLSMLCSMRVHVATLAFVSYAKNDKALSRQHPCSRPRWFVQVCLGKPSPRKQEKVDIIAFFWWSLKQHAGFVQGQPKDYFQRKELDRTFEAIARMN